MDTWECLIGPIILVVAAAACYMIFLRRRCDGCRRFFTTKAGRGQIPELRWYEQGRDTADDLADALTTTLGSTPDPGSRQGGSYDVCTTVYVIVAEWLHCRHCGHVAVAAVPERVKVYHDFPWEAEKRAHQLRTKGVAPASPPVWKVNVHLDRIRNRLQEKTS